MKFINKDNWHFHFHENSILVRNLYINRFLEHGTYEEKMGTSDLTHLALTETKKKGQWCEMLDKDYILYYSGVVKIKGLEQEGVGFLVKREYTYYDKTLSWWPIPNSWKEFENKWKVSIRQYFCLKLYTVFFFIKIYFLYLAVEIEIFFSQTASLAFPEGCCIATLIELSGT